MKNGRMSVIHSIFFIFFYLNSQTMEWYFHSLFKIPKQMNEMNIQNNYLHSIPFSLSN